MHVHSLLTCREFRTNLLSPSYKTTVIKSGIYFWERPILWWLYMLWILPYIFIFDICTVTSQQVKKKKSNGQIFFWDHTCPTWHTKPHHTSHSFALILGWPSLTSYFLFFLFFSLINSSLSLAHPLPPIPPCHHLPIHFSGNITGKSLGISKHLHLLFEVNISNLLVGLYAFAWGYFYLSFNNDTHVIYKHWKWYLCVYMYGFCIGGIIWWVGIWFVLMMTT